MPLFVSTPHLADLVQPFLGRSYAPQECWKLVRDLMHAGGFIETSVERAEVLHMVQEVWWQGDRGDPLTLSQPWDWWLLCKTGPAVGHIALVVDSQMLVHVSPAKADAVQLRPAMERLRHWRPWLVQIARLRSLL